MWWIIVVILAVFVFVPGCLFLLAVAQYKADKAAKEAADDAE